MAQSSTRRGEENLTTRQIRRAAWVGLIANLGLSGLKLAAGLLEDQQATQDGGDAGLRDAAIIALEVLGGQGKIGLGGGDVGLEKTEGILACGGDAVLVAPEVCPALEELVLEPLDLGHTYFDPGDVMVNRFVVGHNAGNEGAEVARPWPLPPRSPRSW